MQRLLVFAKGFCLCPPLASVQFRLNTALLCFLPYGLELAKVIASQLVLLGCLLVRGRATILISASFRLTNIFWHSIHLHGAIIGMCGLSSTRNGIQMAVVSLSLDLQQQYLVK